jgi:hypothetical protein
MDSYEVIVSLVIVFTIFALGRAIVALCQIASWVVSQYRGRRWY